MKVQGSRRIARGGITTFEYVTTSNNEIQVATKGHTHFYNVDPDGNGVAYTAFHPADDRISHEHKIVNWEVLPAQSSCYPNCAEEYEYDGVPLHAHYLEVKDAQLPSPISGPEFPGGTHRTVGKIPLLKVPAAGTPNAFIGYLPAGVSVEVLREMVNKNYSTVRVIPGSSGDDKMDSQIAAFGLDAAEKMLFYVRSSHLAPYESIKGKILRKKYVKPQRMHKLEKVLVPNWVHATEPYYHKGKAEYWVTIKLPYTCTNETNDFHIIQQEAKMKATKELFRHYNLDFGKGDETVITFADGFLSCMVHDYHLEPRPGARLKMLVKIRAIYFDWLRVNGKERRSTKVTGMPIPYKKITIDPVRFQEDVAKVTLNLSKWDRDMRMQGVEIPGVNFTKQGLRMHSFADQLEKFLVANNLDISGGRQTNYLIEIGFDETMQISYIIAKPKPKVGLSQPRIAKTLY